MANFWELLTEMCYTEGIAPSKLCEKIGLSNATATQWKKGAKPSEKSLLLIANYFNIEVKELIAKMNTIDIIMTVENMQNEVEAETKNDREWLKKQKEYRMLLQAYDVAPSNIKEAIKILLEMENCTELHNDEKTV